MLARISLLKAKTRHLTFVETVAIKVVRTRYLEFTGSLSLSASVIPNDILKLRTAQ